MLTYAACCLLLSLYVCILQAMRRTAYDYTLFLDADTYVCAHSLQVNIKNKIKKRPHTTTHSCQTLTPTYAPAASR
jgi:hypothetical protein